MTTTARRIAEWAFWLPRWLWITAKIAFYSAWLRALRRKQREARRAWEGRDGDAG